MGRLEASFIHATVMAELTVDQGNIAKDRLATEVTEAPFFRDFAI